MKKPLVLCILDGCGMRESSDGNAFKNAKKPTFDYLWKTYPHCQLNASEEFVGLPEGQMGTSEVGHMNIGSGRIIYQPLEVINQSIKDGSFFENKKILSVLEHVKKNDSKLHIMGLLSDGGIHSHIDHFLALIDLIKDSKIEKVYYHIFTDGRDTDPKSALSFIEKLDKKIEKTGIGKIATISGRYYAMDRDNNFDRLSLAYDAIVNGKAPKYDSPKDLIEANYNKDITDEFIKPGIINETTIDPFDGVITFNFRKDRLRELFTALTNPNAIAMPTMTLNDLSVLTMFPVTETVKCPHAFDNPDLKNGLGEYLYKNGLSQLRISETEKYAHVTFFFDGGVEREYDNMKKILIPSPKVATYDLKPEMSAYDITFTLIEELHSDEHDVVILNFANGDMLGHTGIYDKAIEAVEVMDECLGLIFKKIQEKEGILLVTADHGNCDTMWDENHNPITSHTLSKVPFILCKEGLKVKDGCLADIAPTMIELLKLVKPKEMTGKSLIKK